DGRGQGRAGDGAQEHGRGMGIIRGPAVSSPRMTTMPATSAHRPPVNRDVPLVGRQALEGPYVLLTFRHPEVAAGARAGQFVMIKANTVSDPILRRPFSVMSVDPGEGTFTLFLRSEERRVGK